MSNKPLVSRSGSTTAGLIAPLSRGAGTPPSQLHLTPGAHVGWGGAAVRVEAIRDRGRVLITELGTAEQLDVPIETLHVLPEQPTAIAFDRVDAHPDEWARVRALALDFEVHIDRAVLPAAISQALAKKYGVSSRCIQRWRKRYLICRRASALLRNPGGRQRGTTQIDLRTERVIHYVIERRYRRGEYVSQLEVAERARSICRRLGWPMPSYRTVARRIVAEAGELMDEARLGAKRAHEKWRPVPGQLFVERPLVLCQIDHTLVDVHVLSSDRQTVLGRPWLTVAIDVATRCVLGIYLTMDAPSAVSVAMCLSHAMLPKFEENRDHPGCWPMYGRVVRVLTDNGKDFRSQAMEEGCAEHGIILDFRPPGKPRYGGHIERMMGTLMRLVHGISGTTFSNVEARGDYKSEQRAAMTLLELREWLVVRICQYYHARRHRALGVAPLVAWDRAWTGASGEITTPPLWADPDLLRLDFMPCTRRMIRRDGISHRRTRYWHPAMAPSVGLRRLVLVRFHPAHLGCIWFRDKDGLMIQADAVAGYGLGQMQTPHTAQETLRLEAAIDCGFTASDEIEAIAEAETRKRPRSVAQSRPRPGRGGQKRLPAPASNAHDDAPAVSPNRASVHTEEL